MSYQVDNFIGKSLKKPLNGKYLDVTSPLTGKICGKVALSSAEDVAEAVTTASESFISWSSLTSKARAKILLKFYHVLSQKAPELAKVINLENGKTIPEALAGIAKGNETVEWAASVPASCRNHVLQVSRGVSCQSDQRPLGVVCSIVPFNFPAMVPLWTIPVALVAGNCIIVKPSEKCPITMMKIVSEVAVEAGLPPGVLQTINGQKEAVEALIGHPEIKAVTFVGSSPVAEIVYQSASRLNKRVLALGGAKNHLVALNDCDVEMTAADVVSSFAGCAGQRCMAASVLVLVGEQKDLLEKIVNVAAKLVPGDGKGCIGPVIDETSKKRILSYVSEAEQGGAEILLDGRSATWMEKEGSWLGPTVILHKSNEDRALKEEIFGPVLSVIVVDSEEDAVALENSSEFGNAACVYTSNGGKSEWFCKRFRAGMIGVNIGIPVPREPFSFGGLYGTKSMLGHSDVTGEGGLSFFTSQVKITTKWAKFQSNDISQFK